jgi:hypothetical protein
LLEFKSTKELPHFKVSYLKAASAAPTLSILVHHQLTIGFNLRT